MTITISHSHFVHVAFVSILVFQTFVIEWYLVDWVFLEQGGIHAVTVRDPQMVRDQKKFGNHWSTQAESTFYSVVYSTAVLPTLLTTNMPNLI